MKLLGLMLIFVGCTGAGYILDMKNKLRLKELAALINTLEQLKGDIDYRLTPLPESCLHLALTSRYVIGRIFYNFGTALEARRDIDTDKMWQEAVNQEKYRYHLFKEDYEIIYEFGHLSGFSDKEMQTNQIEWVLCKLKAITQKGEENKEKISKFYTGMGFLIGACICILLI